MEVLKTDNLTKIYKSVKAVNSVSMTINEGDIYGFVGENGAGKTTVIRLIAGLIRQSKGSYYLFGEKDNSKNLNRVKKDFAAIVESPSLNKSMTALQNLKFQCDILGVAKTNDELNTILERVGLNLENIKNKKVKNFSLGMRQRLGIAITLISNPKFIVLDEPMNGLDPQGFIEVRELILKLNNEGVTFLISSHILDELQKICTKFGFLSHGKLVEEITSEELHNKNKKSIDIISGDLDGLLSKLKNDLNVNDATIDEGKIRIFDNIDINVLIKYLVENGIAINSISCSEDSMETYYLKLMRRSQND